MSHYSAIPVKILDAECLLEALKLFGFEPTCTLDLTHLATLKGEARTAYLQSKLVHLKDYNSKVRPDTAHIVVSRKEISAAANDLGFTCHGENWTMTISDWDKTSGTAKPNGQANRGLGRHFQSRLMNEYCRLVILKQAAALGQTVTVEEVLGGYVIKATQPASKSTKRMMPTQQQQRSRMQSRL